MQADLFDDDDTDARAYTLDELSPRARDKARDWWREQGLRDEWWDAVYDDANEIAQMLGIQINSDGRYGLAIHFSGFWSQGDGARFAGSYRYAEGAIAAVADHCPNDETIKELAALLTVVQKMHGCRLEAKITLSGNCEHAYCTAMEVWETQDDGDEIPTDETTESLIRDAMRRFMDWIYRQLEAEHEYLTSDECVDDEIRDYDWTFTEDGQPIF